MQPSFAFTFQPSGIPSTGPQQTNSAPSEIPTISTSFTVTANPTVLPGESGGGIGTLSPTRDAPSLAATHSPTTMASSHRPSTSGKRHHGVCYSVLAA